MSYDYLGKSDLYILSKISKGNDDLLEYHTIFQKCIDSAYFGILSSYKLLEMKLILDNNIRLPNAVGGRKLFHLYREVLDEQYYKDYNRHINCYFKLTEDKEIIESYIEFQLMENDFEECADCMDEEYEVAKEYTKNEYLNYGQDIELMNIVNMSIQDTFKLKVAKLKKVIKKRKTFSSVKVDMSEEQNIKIIKHIDSFCKFILKYLDDIREIPYSYSDDDYNIVMRRVKEIINQSKSI